MAAGVKMLFVFPPRNKMKQILCSVFHACIKLHKMLKTLCQGVQHGKSSGSSKCSWPSKIPPVHSGSIVGTRVHMRSISPCSALMSFRCRRPTPEAIVMQKCRVSSNGGPQFTRGCPMKNNLVPSL